MRVDWLSRRRFFCGHVWSCSPFSPQIRAEWHEVVFLVHRCPCLGCRDGAYLFAAFKDQKAKSERARERGEVRKCRGRTVAEV